MSKRLACLVVTAVFAGPAAAQAATTLKQNTNDTIQAGHSFSCNTSGANRENSYLRRFHLPDHGITRSFTASSVGFGIESANDGGGTGQPARVRLYSISSSASFTVANLTQLASQDITVLDSESLTIRAVPLVGTIGDPATTDLVAEVFTPDGVAANHSFLLGTNAGGETHPSYIRAPDCSLPEPATAAAAGSPGVHFVLYVTGDEAAENPSNGNPPTGPGPGTGGPAPPGGEATETIPKTTLGKHPRKSVSTRARRVKVTFRFSSDQVGASFECSLDAKRFTPCSSPKSYRVARGKHTFRVRSLNGAGRDTTPARFSFRVLRRR